MSIKRSMKIIGYGTYLPQNKVLAKQIDKILELEEGTVEDKSKIKYRYHANDMESNSYMGAKAIIKALEKSNLKIEDIDLIISASGSKEQMLSLVQLYY